VHRWPPATRLSPKPGKSDRSLFYSQQSSLDIEQSITISAYPDSVCRVVLCDLKLPPFFLGRARAISYNGKGLNRALSGSGRAKSTRGAQIIYTRLAGFSSRAI
jgi:hypothetical protein